MVKLKADRKLQPQEYWSHDDPGNGVSVYNLTSADTSPHVVYVVPPMYPEDAKVNNIEGRVLFQLVVDTDGKAKDPEAISAEPPEVMEIFQEAARGAVLQYEFRPATLNGEDVPCIIRLSVPFKLD